MQTFSKSFFFCVYINIYLPDIDRLHNETQTYVFYIVYHASRSLQNCTDLDRGHANDMLMGMLMRNGRTGGSQVGGKVWSESETAGEQATLG